MQVQGKLTINSSKFIQCFCQKTSSHGTYNCESFTESKVNVKYVNTVKSQSLKTLVKSTTYQIRVFKSNQIFGIKRSKINRLQKTIEYKANEQNTKYLS